MDKTMNLCVDNSTVLPVIHKIVTKLDDTMDIRKMVDRVLYEMQDENGRREEERLRNLNFSLDFPK